MNWINWVLAFGTLVCGIIFGYIGWHFNNCHPETPISRCEPRNMILWPDNHAEIICNVPEAKNDASKK